MYKPIQTGIPRKFKSCVAYKEYTLRTTIDTVLCFWSLHTEQELKENFYYLILPDGCVDIVFDVSDEPSFTSALVMTPHTTAISVNLGKSFSYVGIRLQPGAWLKSPLKIVGEQTMVKIFADFDLEQVREELSTASPSERIRLLERLAFNLKQRQVIGENSLVQLLLVNPDRVLAVKDFISMLHYSRRHVQRIFRERVGYGPHDFLKIIRFQQALAGKASYAYADQSHYIREFKRITGMTPGDFRKTYC
ncbi:helix-turn-helix transcriptional regulator [Acetobacteraceae bacterium]|nr:helix-turn-helix transcriptional regulator [Candidatus Parcubacteria bacterium]